MTIKLVATDMDATFLDDNKHFDNERFSKIYQYMTEHNIYFVSASGNQYYQLKNFFKDYPETLFVAENGTLIGNHSEIFKTWHFSSSVVKNIIHVLENTNDIQYIACGRESAYILKSATEEFYKTSKFYFPRITQVDSLEDVSDDILKFSVDCPPTETEAYMDHLAKDIGKDVSVVSSGHGDIDIIQAEANKATGLEYWSQKLNIKPEEMCAFGDGGNDLEMLRYVGHGVAMENASPTVLETASYQTSNNNQQGVLEHLESIFGL